MTIQLPLSVCAFLQAVFAASAVLMDNKVLLAHAGASLVAHQSRLQLFHSMRTGYTGDLCKESTQCQGTRQCYDQSTLASGPLAQCSAVSERCNCFPRGLALVECTRDATCDPGEICSTVEVSREFRGYCVSEEWVNTSDNVEPYPVNSSPRPKPKPSTSQGFLCVDARALAHFRHTDLVYQNNCMQPVLCDVNGSCATAGHIVVFEGRAMMMKTYCALSRCDEREMLVNSPRYRRRLLVGSKTVGLSYTVFAARYGTELEERILQTAVRVGL